MNSTKVYVLFLLTVVLIISYYHLYIENTNTYNKISSTQNAPALLQRTKQNSVLIYNRVPKTGSTSLMNVAYELFPSNG